MCGWKIWRHPWSVFWMLLQLAVFFASATDERETEERCKYQKSQGKLAVTIVHPLPAAFGYNVLVERQDDPNIFFEDFSLISKSMEAFVYRVSGIPTHLPYKYDVLVRPHASNPSFYLGGYRTCSLRLPPPPPPSSLHVPPSPPAPVTDGGQPLPANRPSVRSSGGRGSLYHLVKQKKGEGDRQGTDDDTTEWAYLVMWVVLLLVVVSFIVFLAVLVTFLIKRRRLGSKAAGKTVAPERGPRLSNHPPSLIESNLDDWEHSTCEV